ncbi:MAG: NUDIX domain-containing protein [bacterium]
MEIIDIVNGQDEVIGQATQDEIYSQAHPHRIVHILIFNSQGEMALQLRSQAKSFCPHHWSTAVGGHVQAGESYEQAALREMAEEANLQLPMQFLYKDIYDDVFQRGLRKFLGVFQACHDGGFSLDSDEVDEFGFFSLAQIQEMVDQGEKFHPELLFLLRKYYGIK